MRQIDTPTVHHALRLVAGLAAAASLAVPAASSAAGTGPACDPPAAGRQAVGHPTSRLAWRATPSGSISVYRGIPGRGGSRQGALAGGTADWLLVLGVARGIRGHCWVKVRLPGRPNTASGWLNAARLLIRPTPWRLGVSVAKRRLTIHRAGRVRRVLRIVVGAPETPTPRGLFSIVHAWPNDPGDFAGAWVLGLTAHSEVLRHFEGGSGEVGIHGRGGASLLDPLGTGASHGCVRVANRAIDWLVRTIGPANLPGIPVRVR